eukprot:XP_001695220.1 predicted protein [Chlamydomonas reinhardtii]
MAPGNRWAARTGLLATLLLALQLARGVVAQSATYPPIAVYDDSDGSDGRDVSRKAALTTSVQGQGGAGVTVVKGPVALSLEARTHVMMANTLQSGSRTTLVNLVDGNAGMLVLTSVTGDPVPDYNALLAPFLGGASPGCGWADLTKTANNVYGYPGMPLSLFAGGSPRPLAFSCSAGAPWFVTTDGAAPVIMFHTPGGGWVKLLGFDWSALEGTVIVLTDPATPSDVTRKTKLRLSVLQMIGQGNVQLRTNPGYAPLHTYILDLVRRGKTLLSIVVTPELPEERLTQVLTSALGQPAKCVKRALIGAAGNTLTAAGFSDYSNLLGVPRFPNTMIPANNTVSLVCDSGRQLVLVEGADAAEEGVMWEMSVGRGTVGFDFTTDGFQTTWQNITLAQRLPAMASIAVANINPLGGRVPAVVMLTDPTPLPDADLKQKLQDGIDALGNSAGLWPFGGGVEGALVHVAFDTTLVRFTASQLASLAALVRARKTVLSVIFTNSTTDVQLTAALAAITGANRLQCSAVAENQRVNRAVPDLIGDLKSDGWRAQLVTRSVRCNTGVILFNSNADSTQAVVHEMSTLPSNASKSGNDTGGVVRLIGYNFFSGGRGDNRKPLTSLTIFSSNLFLAGVREVKDMAIVAQTGLGAARSHVVYDNTYMSLPALVREDLVTRVLTLQTLLTIIVTPGTTTNNITNIAREVTALGGAVPISCTKERVGTGARIRLNPALSILDVLGPWRVDGGTSAVSCAGATGVYLTTDRSRPVILEFLTPGGGTVRFIGYDFSTGARAVNRFLNGAARQSPVKYMPGVSAHIMVDNVNTRTAFTASAKTDLGLAIGTGETILTVIVTPSAATPVTVLNTIIKTFTGYTATCTKAANGVVFACSGIPDGAFIPIYVTASGNTAVAEVITPTGGVLRLVGFDFTSTSPGLTDWAQLVSYNFRIATGAEDSQQ